MKVVNVGPVDNLPRFHGLTKLELFVGPSMWNLLLHFLKSAPNLEILVLNMGNMGEGRRKKEEENCNLPQTCSMLHLKEVEISGPEKIKGVQLLKYIMKNANVLKKFTVELFVYLGYLFVLDIVGHELV